MTLRPDRQRMSKLVTTEMRYFNRPYAFATLTVSSVTLVLMALVFSLFAYVSTVDTISMAQDHLNVAIVLAMALLAVVITYSIMKWRRSATYALVMCTSGCFYVLCAVASVLLTHAIWTRRLEEVQINAYEIYLKLLLQFLWIVPAAVALYYLITIFVPTRDSVLRGGQLYFINTLLPALIIPVLMLGMRGGRTPDVIIKNTVYMLVFLGMLLLLAVRMFAKAIIERGMQRPYTEPSKRKTPVDSEELTALSWDEEQEEAATEAADDTQTETEDAVAELDVVAQPAADESAETKAEEDDAAAGEETVEAQADSERDQKPVETTTEDTSGEEAAAPQQEMEAQPKQKALQRLAATLAGLFARKKTADEPAPSPETEEDQLAAEESETHTAVLQQEEEATRELDAAMSESDGQADETPLEEMAAVETTQEPAQPDTQDEPQEDAATDEIQAQPEQTEEGETCAQDQETDAEQDEPKESESPVVPDENADEAEVTPAQDGETEPQEPEQAGETEATDDIVTQEVATDEQDPNVAVSAPGKREEGEAPDLAAEEEPVQQEPQPEDAVPAKDGDESAKKDSEKSTDASAKKPKKKSTPKPKADKGKTDAEKGAKKPASSGGTSSKKKKSPPKKKDAEAEGDAADQIES